MRVRYVDVHAHINSDRFNEDRKEIVERCEEKGIVIMNCGTNQSSNEKSVSLSREYVNVEACLGIQPLNVMDTSEKELKDISKYIRNHKEEIKGIGEVGLDLYREPKENLEKEVNFFKKMIKLANKLNLPLNVHSRSAEKETIELLKKNSETPVIMHAYSGPEKLVEKGIENNFYFSVPPRFVRSSWYDKILEKIPNDKLLTETDSPWLAGKKGNRNEPQNVVGVVKKIAERRNLEEESLRKQILKNTKEIFDI